MKRSISLILLLAISTFVACAPVAETEQPEVGILAEEEAVMDYSRYNFDTYLKPFWHTREVYNETVLFVGEEDVAPLMYAPSEILSVRNYGLDIEYTEGIDYTIVDGCIKRLSGSSIPFIEVDDYYRITPDRISIELINNLSGYEFAEKRFLMFGEGDTFTKNQIAVSYRHDKPWEGIKIQGAADKFVNALEKIKSGNGKILFFGDSITAGSNASGTIQGGNISPYCDSWPVMVTEFIKQKYSVPLEYINTAIGGTNTQNGVNRFQEDVLAYAPDLLVIAYGMNDGNTQTISYGFLIENMITMYREAVPEGNVLLVSPMLPNVETDWCLNQPNFEEVLADIAEKNDFCALAPITSMHKDILKTGKRYRDGTGNNVNHPNDFMGRVYAQVVLKTILGDDYFVETYTNE